MSIKIEVTNRVVTKNVVRKSDGKQFDIPEQECWAFLPGEQYPTRVVRPVGKGQQPLNPGIYMLAPGAFYVDRYGNIGVRTQFDVVPFPGQVKAA